MKLTTHRMVGWRTSCLRGLVVVLGLIAAAAISAQESKPGKSADSAKPTPSNGEADHKIPDVIQPLTPSIVTVTRIDPKTGKPAAFLNGHAGIVVDPRGYIVTPMVDVQAKTMQFKVRMLNPQLFGSAANGEEFVAELAASDETLKLMILKVKSPHPLAAVSLAKIRDARVGDKVLLVTSPLSRGEFSGRVTSTTVNLGNDDATKIIQTDVKLPLSEYGSLMVSELGEPIGIFMASKAGQPPETLAVPLKVALRLINETTKPNVTENPVDSPKPLQSGLLPPTPLVKSLVELFAPRGAKVLEYEEGKRLKVEAPSDAIEEIGKLLELVGRESQKQEGKAEPVAVPPLPVADSKMPDISGRWRYTKHSEPGGALDGELQIRRTKADASVFSAQLVPRFDPPAPAYLLKWRPDLQKFEVVSTDADTAEVSKGLRIETFQLSANQQSIRQVVTLTEKGLQYARRQGVSQQQIEELYNPNGVVLTRLGAIEPEPNLTKPIAKVAETQTGRSMLGVGVALPDTPAAKQLVEQLGTQESAAAVQAATIRQLQASGLPFKPEIAGHQRELKNLLSTAFDLKLQWEELQVKELQSRLSRLERQIGQRKELREKIINRRAGELIEGDALKWDSTTDDAKPKGVTTTKSKTNAGDSLVIEPSVMSTRFRFVGANGMRLVVENDEGTFLVSDPGNLSFPRDEPKSSEVPR